MSDTAASQQGAVLIFQSVITTKLPPEPSRLGVHSDESPTA